MVWVYAFLIGVAVGSVTFGAVAALVIEFRANRRMRKYRHRWLLSRSDDAMQRFIEDEWSRFSANHDAVLRTLTPLGAALKCQPYCFRPRDQLDLIYAPLSSILGLDPDWELEVVEWPDGVERAMLRDEQARTVGDLVRWESGTSASRDGADSRNG